MISKNKIEINKYYTYKFNKTYLAKCVARYENGGVAIHHYVDHDGKPMIGAAYLQDKDLESGTVLVAERPLVAYINVMYDGDTDTQYFDNQVYSTETFARSVAEKIVMKRPYHRYIKTIEVKP